VAPRQEHRTPRPEMSPSSTATDVRRRHVSWLTGHRSRAHRPLLRARRTPPITIVLAEEQRLVRHGIRCLLESEKDFKVIGETGDGLQVVSLVRRLRPRIVVMAVAMPGLNGLEVARQLREQSLGTAVLMLTMYSKEQYVLEALRNGASGYVLKRARPSELARAIRRVVAGHRYLSEPMSRRSIRTWLRRAHNRTPDPYNTLTDREREILQLVAEGHSSTGIAARLGISARTVEAHRANVLRKMNFHHLADIILFAIARGILAQDHFTT
jgi:two-component system response regulator NreC